MELPNLYSWRDLWGWFPRREAQRLESSAPGGAVAEGEETGDRLPGGQGSTNLTASSELYLVGTMRVKEFKKCILNTQHLRKEKQFSFLTNTPPFLPRTHGVIHLPPPGQSRQVSPPTGVGSAFPSFHVTLTVPFAWKGEEEKTS